jgi:hypothetical protein
MVNVSPKALLQWNWEQGIILCPNQVAVYFQVDQVVHFPADRSCPSEVWDR